MKRSKLHEGERRIFAGLPRSGFLRTVITVYLKKGRKAILVQDWKKWKAWKMTSNSRIQFNVKVSLKLVETECSVAVWVMMVICSKGWKCLNEEAQRKKERFRIYGDTQKVGGSSSCKSSSSTSLPASPLLPFLREKEKHREKWIIIFLNYPCFDPVVDFEKADFWVSIVYKVWSTIQIIQAKNRSRNHRCFFI